MNKTLMGLATAALMIGTFTAYTVQGHTVNVSGLNVRTGPGFGCRVIRVLAHGTEVNTVSTSGSWTKINRPLTGWVYSRYLSNTSHSGGGSSTSGSVAGTFTGTAYKYGRAYTISLTRIDGKAVAARSAGPFLAMRAAARSAGVYIYVVSGFRTMAEQQYLYRLYGSPRAARPGYSNHQSGTAFDLNASWGSSAFNWLTRNAGRYGFQRTVSFEPWHWEYMR